MSMLTPRGASTSRRRVGVWRRVLAVLVALVLLAAGGAAAWQFLVRHEPAVRAAAGCQAPPAGSPVTPRPPKKAAPARFLPGKPIAASSVQLNVFNATKRAGLAKSVGKQLVARHFMVTGVNNDPLRKAVKAPAEVRYGAKGAGAALTLAAQVAGAVPVVDKRKGAGVDLVLGAGFKSLRTPAQAKAAATPVAAPKPAPKPSASPGC